MKKALALIALLALAVPAFAAVTEKEPVRGSGRSTGWLTFEEQGTANTELISTTTGKVYVSTLHSVSVVCSASTTITVSQQINRTLDSGAVTILLPDIDLTATTSGAMLTRLHLLPQDTITVTVPAAGAGITCDVSVVQEVRL